MENKLNILHYCIYFIHYKVHLLFSKINPFNLLHKLPFQQKRYEELGIDIQDEINKAFKNSIFGLSVMTSGGMIIGLTFLTILSLSLVFLNLVGINFTFTWYHFIIFGLLSYFICYFSIFRNDKYLKYFEEFQKWSVPERKKTILISLGFVFLIVLSFFGSLLWID